jgi:hypothetical protein
MSDARIDRLEQEVRSLRRALYGMAALALALGSAAIVSCNKSSAPPTKLVFTDASGGEVTLDASGLRVKDAEHLVTIGTGRVSASHVQVVTHGSDKGGSVEIKPDQISLHTGPALVTLYVNKQTGARIQVSDDDSHADITTKDDAAGFALTTTHGKVRLDTGKDGACTRVERQLLGDTTASPGDTWAACAPPAKP